MPREHYKLHMVSREWISRNRKLVVLLIMLLMSVSLFAGYLHNKISESDLYDKDISIVSAYAHEVYNDGSNHDHRVRLSIDIRRREQRPFEVDTSEAWQPEVLVNVVDTSNVTVATSSQYPTLRTWGDFDYLSFTLEVPDSGNYYVNVYVKNPDVIDSEERIYVYVS